MMKQKSLLSCVPMLITVMLSICTVQAQRRLASPMFLHMNDRMIEPDKYSKLESGSPFFSDDWQKATVVLANETIIDNLPVRINLFTNELHYLDSLGREMVSTQKVKAVLLQQAHPDSLVTFVSNAALEPTEKAADDSWLQLLVKGDASLLKRYKKAYIEIRPYSSSSPQATMTTDVQYLLWHKNRLTPIKGLDELKQLLALKEPESKKNKWALESEYVRLVNYYNLAGK